jgi:uncharacterized protein
MTSRPAHQAVVPPGAALRVSDAERDQAVEMLQAAFADGRIDHAELDRRIGEALAATYRADLSHAMRGLPLAGRANGLDHPVGGGRTVETRTRELALTPEERTWALIAHWSGVVTLFVGPVLIAMTKGKTSRFVRAQAYESTNFQVSFLAAIIVLGLATAMTFGIAGILYAPLAMAWLLLTGVGGLSAAVGNRWRYPWNLRLFS